MLIQKKQSRTRLQPGVSMTQPCEIIPDGRKARIHFFNFQALKGLSVADANLTLVRNGYHRDRTHYSSMHCDDCTACKPLRLVLEHFRKRASHNKILEKNRDIQIAIPDSYDFDEHYQLFTKHRISRRLTSDETLLEKENFSLLIENEYLPFSIMEARLDGKLVGASLFDMIPPDSMVGAHYYYDTDLSRRSVGIFLLLKAMEHAVASNLKYFYHGPTTEQPSKLSYKNAFGPGKEIMERDQRWYKVPEPEPGI